MISAPGCSPGRARTPSELTVHRELALEQHDPAFAAKRLGEGFRLHPARDAFIRIDADHHVRMRLLRSVGDIDHLDARVPVIGIVAEVSPRVR